MRLNKLEEILCISGCGCGLFAIASQLENQQKNIPLIITTILLLAGYATISTYREYREDKEEELYST